MQNTLNFTSKKEAEINSGELLNLKNSLRKYEESSISLHIDRKGGEAAKTCEEKAKKVPRFRAVASNAKGESLPPPQRYYFPDDML